MQEASRGRELARAMIARVQPHAAAVTRKLGRPATLAIVAGSDDDGRRFVQIKRDMLVGVDFSIEAVWVDEETSTAEALAIVADLNQRNEIDAIFLQFPLPAQIDAHALSNEIAIEKDIDCSSERAEEAFLTGKGEFIPVAPLAALDLLRHELGSLANRNVTVFGEEDPFSRALLELLRRDGAVAVTTLDASLDALVVIAALPGADEVAHIKRLAVILDAGYFLKPRRSDWVPASLRAHTTTYLTQYGNVGPLTVAHLTRTTIEAADLRAAE